MKSKLLTKTALALTFAASIIGMSGCSRSDWVSQEDGQKYASQMNPDKAHYAVDARTDVCFAYDMDESYGTGNAAYRATAMIASVPCSEAVRRAAAERPADDYSFFDPGKMVYKVNPNLGTCFAYAVHRSMDSNASFRYIGSFAGVNCTDKVLAQVDPAQAQSYRANLAAGKFGAP